MSWPTQQLRSALRFASRLALVFTITSSLHGRADVETTRVNSFPFELVNEARYHATVNGQPLQVMRAGLNVYLVSFDFAGKADMQVDVEEVDRIRENLFQWHAIDEAPKRDADYFRGQAIIRPSSRNVAATTTGNRARFRLTEPGQYSLEAPGVSKANDEVLLIFANPPEPRVPDPADPNVIFLRKGLHQEHITLHSNQTLYLQEGAVLVGALNVWDAQNVTIRGRGTVLYQDPLRDGRDNGPYNVPNQHALTTSNVNGLHIEGVTFVVRSQTWSVQLVRTSNVLLDNVKVVNVTPNNINGDGIDWMDCSHVRVLHSFIRSSDDNLAFLAADALKDFRPEDPARVEHFGTLTDFLVQDGVFWNTFGSALRLGWTSQSLTTSNIHLNRIDVIHGRSLLVIGIPKRPAHARHSNYLVESMHFEDPAQVVNWTNDPTATYDNFVFRDITLPHRADGNYRTEPQEGVRYEDVRAIP